MSELIESFSGEFRYHWEWLAGSSIKATVWLLFVLAVLQVFRRISASWRHTVAICGAVGVPLVFVLNLSSIPAQLGWRPFADTITGQAGLKTNGTVLMAAGGGPSEASVPMAKHLTGAPAVSGAIDPGFGILALWTLGCFVVGIRLLLRLRRPRLAEVSDAPAELTEALERECAKAMLCSTPALQMAPEAMPMVYGIRRAAIILPTGAIDWPEQKLSSVLRHELTHLQRQDVSWSMIIEAALLPLWWHPLARILRRKAFEWTEQACDDAVIASGIAPTQYATDLLSLTRQSTVAPGYALAALSERGQKARFRRVLDENASRAAVTSGRVARVGLLAVGLLVPATLLVSCSTVPKDVGVQDLPEVVAPPIKIPAVAGDAKQIRLAVKIFEVDFPSDKDLENPALAEWIRGNTKLLSSTDGSELFDPRRPGSDILSAPQIVTEPGQHAKLEVGQQVPVSGGEKTIFAKVGIEIDSQVWPTGDPDTLKVNVIGNVSEVVGYKPDETGFEVPQIRRLEGRYQGLVKNGSYLLIGQLLEPVILRDKVPVLGDIPFLGRLFRTSETRPETKLIAAHLIFSEAP